MATTDNGVTELSPLEYCSNMTDLNLLFHLPVIPAIFIIVLLSSLERRRYKANFLGGRFGLVVPMENLNGHKYRWRYTAASVAIATPLLMMFERTFSVDVPLWAKVFMVYLQGLEIAIQCFPLFACIGTRFRLVGGICNTLYILMSLGLNVTVLVQICCQFISRASISMNVIIAIALFAVPCLLSLVFLLIVSMRTSLKCLLRKQYVQDEDSQRVAMEEHYKTFLKISFRNVSLLNPSEETGWKFWQYKSVPGYKFPTRILCAVAVVLSLVGSLTILTHVAVIPYIHTAIKATEDTLGKPDCNAAVVYCLFIIFLRVVNASTYFAAVVSLVIVVTNVLLFLRSYRRAMFRLFKGDKSFIITQRQLSQKYMAQNMRFMGYFIAYNLWGYFVIYSVLMILCIIDGIAWEYLAERGRLGSLILRMLELSVYPLSGMVIFYAQTYLAKRFLLQKRVNQCDKDPPLALNNRKFYNVLSYHLLFVNVAVGVISCIARTASSFILALFQIGRLDKNLFLSGWHEKDRGYASYVAMLHVDYTHNHPALRVFCSLLWEKVLQQPNSPVGVTSPNVYIDLADIAEHNPSLLTSRSPRSHVYASVDTRREDLIQASSKRRILNRWQLAYTLQRNPSLIELRRRHPPQPEITGRKEEQKQQSVTSCFLEWTPLIVYKVSLASPLIIIAIMVAVPFVTIGLFL